MDVTSIGLGALWPGRRTVYAVKSSTATVLSVLMVTGAGALAYRVNTMLLAENAQTSPSVIVERRDGAAPVAEQVRTETVPPVPDAAGSGSQTFDLGRLGVLTAHLETSGPVVDAVRSAWDTLVEHDGPRTAVYYTNGAERFRFDLTAAPAGLTGALTALAPLGAPDDPAYRGGLPEEHQRDDDGGTEHGEESEDEHGEQDDD